MQKYTLITGASSGMGECCAKELSHSRNIILSGSNLERLQSVKSQCYYQEKHLIWCCDFASQRSDIFESLSSLLKQNDALIVEFVHFAGVTQILPIKNFTISYVDKIFNVNFFSAIEILRVLLRKNNQKALTNVIFISAMVSRIGDKGNSIYAASKGAMNSLVYSLAQELAPMIRVNALLPGAIVTPMTETKVTQEHLDKLKVETPLGLGRPEDVIHYVEFLLSDSTHWITGQTIFVDGGRSTK